jgi:hypothetical protein
LADEDATEKKKDGTRTKVLPDKATERYKQHICIIDVRKQIDVFVEHDGIPEAEDSQGSIGVNEVLPEFQMVFHREMDSDLPGAVDAGQG